MGQHRVEQNRKEQKRIEKNRIGQDRIEQNRIGQDNDNDNDYDNNDGFDIKMMTAEIIICHSSDIVILRDQKHRYKINYN